MIEGLIERIKSLRCSFEILYHHKPLSQFGGTSLGWFIWTQHIDQLPVGLLGKLVERCTGIAEVMGSNPVQSEFFFRSYFNY